MNDIHVPGTEETIHELRDWLGRVYRYVDETEQKLKQFEMLAGQAGQKLDEFRTLTNQSRHKLSDIETQIEPAGRLLSQLDEGLASARTQFQARLKPMDDAATVMQRELTHLEESSGEALMQHPDVTIRAVSALLQTSIRLASLFFPPEQLQRLAEESNSPNALDMLRLGWKRWLEALAEYLTQVLPLAGSLAKLGGVSPMTEPYQQAWRKVCQLCQQMEASGTPAQPSQTAMEQMAPQTAPTCKEEGTDGARLFDIELEKKEYY